MGVSNGKVNGTRSVPTTFKSVGNGNFLPQKRRGYTPLPPGSVPTTFQIFALICIKRSAASARMSSAILNMNRNLVLPRCG